MRYSKIKPMTRLLYGKGPTKDIVGVGAEVIRARRII